MEPSFPDSLQLHDVEGRTAEQLIADAQERSDAGRTVEAAALGYLALRTADPATQAHAHLFLSEAMGELRYRAMERIHARAALRACNATTDPDSGAHRVHARLGAVAMSAGDHAVAEYHFQRALQQAKQHDSPESADLVAILLDLARLSLHRANVDSTLSPGGVDHLAGAAKWLDKAVAAIEDQAPDPWLWTNVSELQARMLIRGSDHLPAEDHPLREQMLETAAESLRTVIEQRHLLRPRDAQSLVEPMTDLAGVLRRTGHLVEAAEVNDELLNLTELLQRVESGVVMSMTLLAAQVGDTATLTELCDIVMRDEESRVAEFASLSGEAVALASSAQMRLRSMKCLALLGRAAVEDRTSARMMLDIALRRKAVVADAEELFWRTLYGHPSPKVAIARTELLALRNRLSEQVLRGEGTGLWTLIDEIETREEFLSVEPWWEDFRTGSAQTAEREAVKAYATAILSGASPWDAVADSAGLFSEERVNVETVARHLPPGSVLVEFVKVQDYDLDRDLLLDSGRYLAFVLDAETGVVAHDLGDAADLEAEIHAQLAALHTGDRLRHKPQLAAMASLYDRIWARIASDVCDATSVILSPDGVMGVVPFACLLAPDGRFLIECTTLFHVATGRQIAEADSSHTSEAGPAVVVADPDYDAEPAHDEATAEVSRSPTRRFEFRRLTGSAVEATIVRELLGPQTVVLARGDASEPNVRTVHRPTVLHLATHGVFDQAAAIESDGLGQEDALALESAYLEHVKTLSRTGLALTGVNSGRSPQKGQPGDGFLTAFDVVGMDLSGTDLVTLTACESGRGTLLAGEGVLGLARSFRIAGARHVVMSLWRLSDKEANRQMRLFYAKYASGEHPAIALRDTQRARIERLRNVLGHAPPPALWGALTVRGI